MLLFESFCDGTTRHIYDTDNGEWYTIEESDLCTEITTDSEKETGTFNIFTDDSPLAPFNVATSLYFISALVVIVLSVGAGYYAGKNSQNSGVPVSLVTMLTLSVLFVYFGLLPVIVGAIIIIFSAVLIAYEIRKTIG